MLMDGKRGLFSESNCAAETDSSSEIKRIPLMHLSGSIPSGSQTTTYYQSDSITIAFPLIEVTEGPLINNCNELISGGFETFDNVYLV